MSNIRVIAHKRDYLVEVFQEIDNKPKMYLGHHQKEDNISKLFFFYLKIILSFPISLHLTLMLSNA